MMNTQRRIFRGRGGPNDRRLPKYNARRRRPHPIPDDEEAAVAATAGATPLTPPSAPNNNNNNNLPGHDIKNVDPPTAPVPSLQDENPSSKSFDSSSSSGSEDDSNAADDDRKAKTDDLEVVPSSEGEDDSGSEGNDEQPDTNTSVLDELAASDHLLINEGEDILDEDSKLRAEVHHLLQRIQNNRTSFSIAQNDGLSSLDSYQMNVLNAVENCVVEWRCIWRQYNNNSNDDHDSDDLPRQSQRLLITRTLAKQAGQALFELLQQALQCGPLSGSNPGYFKRCGSQVATMVHSFLCRIMATCDEGIKVLQFTDKQSAVIETWKTSALKASESGKPPSKSVLKKQNEADKQRQRKQQLQEKKKKRRER